MHYKVILDALIEMGITINDDIQHFLNNNTQAERIAIDHKRDSDIIYKIDFAVEQSIKSIISKVAEEVGGITLIAEGIGDNDISIYPSDADPDQTTYRMIMDPIDGTRPLIYDKRSAFLLVGVAKNKGTATRLSDIEFAFMFELGTTKQYLLDCLSVIKGETINAFRYNRLNGEKQPFDIQLNDEPSIRGGYAQLCRFMTPGKAYLAEIEDELIENLYDDIKEGELLTFEDQYLSSGGQLYEMIMGRDRFIADLRETLINHNPDFSRKVHTCQPYDLAAILIAQELGIILEGPDGKTLDGPMNTTTAMDWIAYANKDIYLEIAPKLHSLIDKYTKKTPLN